MTISIQEFKKISNALEDVLSNTNIDLANDKIQFKASLKDGEHTLNIEVVSSGELIEINRGWNDYTQDAKQLNKLLGYD